MPKYKFPKEAVSLLTQVKNVMDPAADTTAIDVSIAEAQLELSAEIQAEVAKVFKQRCEALLRACDYSQLPDSGLSTAKKTEFDTYRAALRALPVPTTYTDLDAVVYPTAPMV